MKVERRWNENLDKADDRERKLRSRIDKAEVERQRAVRTGEEQYI